MVSLYVASIRNQEIPASGNHIGSILSIWILLPTSVPPSQCLSLGCICVFSSYMSVVTFYHIFLYLSCSPKFCCPSSSSVMSHSLWPHELKPAMLLCPWSSPGKNTEVDTGEDFPDPGIQTESPVLRQILYCHEPQG